MSLKYFFKYINRSFSEGNRESTHYLENWQLKEKNQAFILTPVWTVLLGNQIGQGKYLLYTPNIWIRNDRTRISLFATSSKWIGLGTEHQQQVTSGKEGKTALSASWWKKTQK